MERKRELILSYGKQTKIQSINVGDICRRTIILGFSE
jgi:hypothetical protein